MSFINLTEANAPNIRVFNAVSILL